MEEKSLFIKLEKQEKVNDIIREIEKNKEQITQKIETMKEIIIKEQSLLENFEDKLKRIDDYVENANNIINTQ